MNPSVATTVAGDLATMWRRFATVTTIQLMVVASQLRMLTNPHLLRARCRPFRRIRILVARDLIKAKGRQTIR